MGLMNLVFPFFGECPSVTAPAAAASIISAPAPGANILEGLIEILLGLLLASSLPVCLRCFRKRSSNNDVLVGLEMVKFAECVV